MPSDPLATVIELTRAATLASRRVDRPLSAHGLSLVDLMILLSLSGADGRLRRVDLAERLGMSQSSVTRLLAPLEKIGLVRRERDPNDRRAAFAELTGAGRRVAAEAAATAREAAEDLLRGWPASELDALAGGVTRLAAGMPSIIPVRDDAAGGEDLVWIDAAGGPGATPGRDTPAG